MKILAVDTSTQACSAALLAEGNYLERFEIQPRQHTKLILPMLQSLLDEAKLELSELDRLAFASGPGSFTGIRIATGIIQGLSFASDLPVIAVSTLAAMAQSAHRIYGFDKVIVCQNAGMQEVYTGAYELKAGYMQCVSEERVCAPDLVNLPKTGSWAGVGSGWSLFVPTTLQLLTGICEVLDNELHPHAQEVAFLATDPAKKCITSAELIMPTYLRNNVVQN